MMLDVSPTPPRQFKALRAIMLALTGGLLASAIFCMMGYIWIVSRLPMLTLLPIVLESTGIGLVLGWLYRRLNVRRLPVCIAIALICGVLGATYCYYSFYIREAQHYVEATRQEWSLYLTPGSKEFDDAIRPTVEHPLETFDKVIYNRTHRHGLLGYMFAGGGVGAALWLVYVFITVILALQFGWAEPRPIDIAPHKRA